MSRDRKSALMSILAVSLRASTHDSPIGEVSASGGWLSGCSHHHRCRVLGLFPVLILIVVYFEGGLNQLV